MSEHAKLTHKSGGCGARWRTPAHAAKGGKIVGMTSVMHTCRAPRGSHLCRCPCGAWRGDAEVARQGAAG